MVGGTFAVEEAEAEEIDFGRRGEVTLCEFTGHELQQTHMGGNNATADTTNGKRFDLSHGLEHGRVIGGGVGRRVVEEPRVRRQAGVKLWGNAFWLWPS